MDEFVFNLSTKILSSLMKKFQKLKTSDKDFLKNLSTDLIKEAFKYKQSTRYINSWNSTKETHRFFHLDLEMKHHTQEIFCTKLYECLFPLFLETAPDLSTHVKMLKVYCELGEYYLKSSEVDAKLNPKLATYGKANARFTLSFTANIVKMSSKPDILEDCEIYKSAVNKLTELNNDHEQVSVKQQSKY